jgi:hypothetical protein
MMVVALAAFGLGGISTWMVNGWRLEREYERERKEFLEGQNELLLKQKGDFETEAERLRKLAQGYIVERNAAEKAMGLRMDNLRDGVIRLSVPIVPGGCPNPEADPGRTASETRAELAPKAARDLERIAHDGDEAIRQLNKLIEACE